MSLKDYRARIHNLLNEEDIAKTLQKEGLSVAVSLNIAKSRAVVAQKSLEVKKKDRDR